MELESIRIKNTKRGPSSSSDFNKVISALQRDTATLFDGLNKNDESIKSNMDVLMRENHFYQVQMNQLKNQIKELEERYLNDDYRPNTMKVYKDFFNIKDILFGEKERQANIDLEAGLIFPQVTDATSKFSYMTDSGEVFLPSGLEIYAKESNDTLPKNKETNEIIYSDIDSIGLDAIVDRDYATHWTRTVAFKEEDCVTELYGEIHIKVPVSKLNNLYSNSLKINPYPEGSLTIRDIYYKGHGDQWARLPNFPVALKNNREYAVPIANAKKMQFFFPKMDVTEVRIMFSQPYWFENDNKRAFTYGFQDIDLEYRIYSEKSTEFVTKLDTTSDTTYFKSIKNPTNLTPNGSEEDLTNLVEHHLYYDSELTTEFEFGSNILAPLNTVYIKTVLRKEGDKIPILSGLEFEYEFKTNELIQ